MIAIDKILRDELLPIRIQVVGGDQVVNKYFKAIAGSKYGYFELNKLLKNSVQKKRILGAPIPDESKLLR